MFASRTAWNLAPNRLARALAEHRAAGREVLDLTESNPTRCGFQYDRQFLEALADPAGLEYRPDPKGLRSAREAVASYYAERAPGATAPDPENIFLTASTSEAYTFLFRLLCDAGDELLVPAPSYPLFDFLAALQDVKLVAYPLLYDHGWQIDLHSLRTALTPRSRAVLLVHPNNPTGSFLKPQEMEALGELCGERGLAVVADEVFLDYAHDGLARASSVASPAALTFTLSGLSKVAALPQMKVAWLVASGPAQSVKTAVERLEVIADTYLSVSTPVQLALPEWLRRRHGIQGQVAARLRQNLGEMDRQLAAQEACRRLEVEGGWYAVLRVPATRPDEELAVSLLQQRSVLTHPGHFYDFPTDGYLVVSLLPPAEVFREGVGRALQFLRTK